MKIDYSRQAAKFISSLLMLIECKRLEEAEQDYIAGDTISHDEIDWN